ncbi:MAG: pyridoxal phosphate-dependent aminotransferase, partial [Muribaculaceae bacterium]|nr:pyridoxal phosphate-dependent aminotransferase [Muribaculaceae bacterium]
MYPLEKSVLDNVLAHLEIPNITSATIRQIVSVSMAMEREAGERCIHLELGNPGLPAESIGIAAECAALNNGVANKYPDIGGIPQLKQAGSDFLKAFMDVDVPAHCIVPTVGSMQGSFTLMLLLKQRLAERDTMLIINPGFPAQRHQAKLLGMNVQSFDIYNYRG